jgi:hypothetical protein
MTKAKALLSLRPGAEWALHGDDLVWLDTTQTRPTDAEIAAEVARLEALQPALARIAELKAFLRDTDYVALSDYDKDKPEIITQRAAWRAEIRELEAAHLAAQAQNGV